MRAEAQAHIDRIEAALDLVRQSLDWEKALRRLEELELIAERDALMQERADIEDLLESDDLQWAKIAEQLRETRNRMRS